MGRDKRKLKVTDWLQNLVVDKPEKFQNDVGEFIVEAIREKVERGDYLQTELRKP